MKRGGFFGSLVLLTGLFLFSGGSLPVFALNEDPGESYVVVLGTPEDPARSSETVRATALRHGLQADLTYTSSLTGFSARVPESKLRALREDPAVLFVSPDRVGRTTAQTIPTGIDRVQADASSARAGNGRGSVNADIAVVDTGVDPQDPDLNVAGGKDCLNSGGFDDDRGHGTSVARIAAARDNGTGVVGVAPGARVWSVKAVGEIPTVSQVVCGVDWITANADRIEAASMSFVLPGSDDGACGLRNGDALHYAICNSARAGVTYVAAAGNSRGGADFSRWVPAAYNEVLTATAMADYNGKPGGKGLPRPGCPRPRTPDDAAATSFSGFAAPGSPDSRHTIAAPGVCVPVRDANGRTFLANGTSLSAPYVAGAAALYASRHPGASSKETAAALLKAAARKPAAYGFRGDPRSPVRGRHYGYLLDAGSF